MILEKPKRIQDRDLLDDVKSRPCCACGTIHTVDPAHLISVGAGGHDTEENVVPLCRRHHIESHKIGLYKFAKRYPGFQMELIRKGWEFNDDKKLRRRL